jgi:hypothetical protein
MTRQIVDLETGEISELQGFDDVEFLNRFARYEREMEEAIAWVSRYKQEAHRRLRESGASKLYGDGLEYHDQTTVDYDRSQLPALAEQFTPQQYTKSFTPEHESVIMVPSKWDMTQVKKAVKEKGLHTELAKLTFPGQPKGRLVIKETKE